MKKLSAVSLAFFAAVATASAGQWSSNGCTANWSDTELTVGNALFSRTYAAKGDVLRTVSFAAKDAAVWSGVGVKAEDRQKITVAAENAAWGPAGIDGVRLHITCGKSTTEMFLFPTMAGVIVKRPEIDSFKSVHDQTRDFMTLKEDAAAMNSAAGKSDGISIDRRHIKATLVTCLDQTDIRDNLVDINERLLMYYDWKFSAAATALDCRDVLTGDGIVFVRIAPMPASRPNHIDDFILDRNQAVFTLANGYPLAELVYRGGEAGRQRVVQAFQRALRPYRPGRDGILLSNTWGAGNGDSRICQDFLIKEIEAGAEMGVDVIQIDDGWQRGRTANSSKQPNPGIPKVWNNYWKTDPKFWTEDIDRFPDGLAFLVKKAADKGLRFGLWFGPDSADDSENWEKDADCLLDYSRRLGINYFKMDSLKLRSKKALENNRKMFDKMLRESKGQMVFDLDCTAEIRPGFFGLMDIGTLFLENRYTKRPVYWPHHTLKNLWDLSHYIDPVRLRVEFNNPDTNHGNFSWSPLSVAKYRPDALFATVMTGSPLAWMELSDVSEKSRREIATLVARWKKERARWHGGTIHPVASRPDGVAWTGFVSEAADGNGGYALLFRELNESAAYSLDLAPIFGKSQVETAEVIGGRGTAKVNGTALDVTVGEKLDYVWIRLGR